MFEDQGIGGASIEAIAAAAGFTRGAFYSNFKSKDELIIAMLEDHVEQSMARVRDLLERHKNLADFIEALKTMGRSRQDPLGRSPLLYMEMILFVARAEKRRPELAKRLRAGRKLIADVIETTAKNTGKDPGLTPAWWGSIVLAMEEFWLSKLRPMWCSGPATPNPSGFGIFADPAKDGTFATHVASRASSDGFAGK